MTPAQENEVREAVRGLIVDVLKRKKLDASSDRVAEGISLTRDLGIDSLDVLQLTATVEKRYKLRIPQEELKGMDDLGGIMAALKRHWPSS